MSKTIFHIAAAALAIPAALLLSVGSAQADSRDQRVCYADTDHPPTRIVLDVKFHSRLPTTYYGGRQSVYDADGKHAYTEGYPPENRMAVFDGSIVTSSGSSYQPRGAHLGGPRRPSPVSATRRKSEPGSSRSSIGTLAPSSRSTSRCARTSATCSPSSGPPGP